MNIKEYLTPKNILTAVIIALPILAFGGWIAYEATRPLPGQAIEDLGRQHVPVGTTVQYNSNPPTSGNHYEVWTRAGVFNEPLDDRNMVHSLEHGYIIISYNCGFKTSLIPQAFAQESPQSTPQEATQSAALPEQFQSEECKNLVSELTKIYEAKDKRKLIVVPRPILDAKIALTAWGRIDKFDDYDKARIERFVDVLRDHGPEKTME